MNFFLLSTDFCFQINFSKNLSGIPSECHKVKYIQHGKKIIKTLKAPITTAADDKFCNIFPSFQQK